MNREERIGRNVGYLCRMVGGAGCFGIWQNSFYAGLFAFVLLVSIEREST